MPQAVLTVHNVPVIPAFQRIGAIPGREVLYPHVPPLPAIALGQHIVQLAALYDPPFPGVLYFQAVCSDIPFMDL